MSDAEAAVDEAELLHSELVASTHLAPFLPWLQAKHGPERAAAYSPTWNAMVVLLKDGFSPCDSAKLTTFGLFREDAPVPVELLAAAWRLDGDADSQARCAAVVAAFEAATLLKRGRDGCVTPHDLTLDLAQVRAMWRCVVLPPTWGSKRCTRLRAHDFNRPC